MSSIIVTIDIDWAPECAIEETLSFFAEKNILPTIFTTHPSKVVESALSYLDVGLHPYFGFNSSHGKSIPEVVSYVMDLPHNLPAFRCHRFGVCNSSKKAMVDAGMLISSNVCTDLEIVNPFKDRFGLLEVPIFLEDGGYLLQNHPLEVTSEVVNLLSSDGFKVIIVHPMHFAINTPNFSYMSDIKSSLSRLEWQNMDYESLNKLKWRGRGIRDFILDLVSMSESTFTLAELMAFC